MKKEKRIINTEGGAYIEGNVNISGKGKFINRDDRSQTGVPLDEVTKLFESIFFQIENHPKLSSIDKSDVRQEIEEVREELSKIEQSNESYILRRLRNIGRMAPDILEIVLATITSPVAGFGLIAKKIAEKAKTFVS